MLESTDRKRSILRLRVAPMMETVKFHPFQALSLSALTLREDEIHLWSADLNPPARMIRALSASLSPDETKRAGGFLFERDRRRYRVSRGLLRTLLSGYTDVPAHRLRFTYGRRGKPQLLDDSPDLHFNLSHSADLVVLAFTSTHPLGVDIEHLRPVPDAESIAKRYFSPGEYKAFRRLPPDRRQEAFFNCWTRKEAYIKAVGDGLSVPLDRFEVTIPPGEPAKMLALDGHSEKAAEWSLYHLKPMQDYVGALAIPAGGWRLAARNLDISHPVV